MNLATVFNDNKNFLILFIKRLIVKLIAQGFVDYNISNVYTQLFTFDNKDLYVENGSSCENMTFEEIINTANGAIPMGIYRDGKVLLNPAKSEIYRSGDRLIMYEEKKSNYSIVTEDALFDKNKIHDINFTEHHKGVCTIFGYNDILIDIIEEINSDVKKIVIVIDETVILNKENKKELNKIKSIYDNVEFTFADYWEESELKAIAENSNHIIVLSGYSDADTEDVEIINMMKVFKLRKLREKYNLKFNMIVELISRDNKAIDMDDMQIDFIIANEIPSMLLAQISESPELFDVYVELLSNGGNNVFVRSFDNTMDIEISVRELRNYLYDNGYILLGIIKNDKHIEWAMHLDKKIKISKEMSVVFIGK